MAARSGTPRRLQVNPETSPGPWSSSSPERDTSDMVHFRGTVVFRADDGTRTRDPNLGKVVLYQRSHVRVPGKDSNRVSGRPGGSDGMGGATAGNRSPLDLLGVLGIQEVVIAPGLRHLEIYTATGLVTVLWHGEPDAAHIVVACGGAMGGLLGPANGLYHDVGTSLTDQGIATLRVGYRRPNDMDRCFHDPAAVADLAWHRGGRQFVTMGHSCGGGVAVQAGIVLGRVATDFTY